MEQALMNPAAQSTQNWPFWDGAEGGRVDQCFLGSMTHQRDIVFFTVLGFSHLSTQLVPAVGFFVCLFLIAVAESYIVTRDKEVDWPA